MLTAKTREALEKIQARIKAAYDVSWRTNETDPPLAPWKHYDGDPFADLKFAVEAALAVSGSQGQWQPIESAPKNRSLVYVPHFGITIALPCSDGTWWSYDIPGHECQPTLWWPMPPLPPLRLIPRQETDHGRTAKSD
jgi:hypothetical protein